MKKIVVALGIVLLFAIGGYGFWIYYQQVNSVTLVFADAQGVGPGTGVWMAGVEIGTVQKIQIATDGVEVRVFLRQQVRDQLTERALFVIDPGFENGGVPVVRVKAGSGGTAPLQANSRIKGVNSFALWKLDDYSQKMFEFINEPQLQDGLRKLEQLGNELQKK